MKADKQTKNFNNKNQLLLWHTKININIISDCTMKIKRWTMEIVVVAKMRIENDSEFTNRSNVEKRPDAQYALTLSPLAFCVNLLRIMHVWGRPIVLALARKQSEWEAKILLDSSSFTCKHEKSSKKTTPMYSYTFEWNCLFILFSFSLQSFYTSVSNVV